MAGFAGAGVQGEKQFKRPGERRYGSCVPPGETQRERVEQDVGRARRAGSGRRGERGLGRLPHPAGAAQVPCPHRGHERFQVRLAGQAGIQRVEEPGRAEQQPGHSGAALLVSGDLAAQVLRLCGAQRVGRAGPGGD